jgi:hypothetical protein
MRNWGEGGRESSLRGPLPSRRPSSPFHFRVLLPDSPLPSSSRSLTSSLMEPLNPHGNPQPFVKLPGHTELSNFQGGTLFLLHMEPSSLPKISFPSPRRTAILPSVSLGLPTDPSASQGEPHPLKKPPLLSSLAPSRGSPGPSLTPRFLHRTPVQFAVALQRGDVRRAADLRRRRPTPRPAPGPSFLPAPALHAFSAPLLWKPHRVKFRVPWPPLQYRRVPGRENRPTLEAEP